MYENLQELLEQLPAWIEAVLVLMAAASGITMLTKSDRDNKALQVIVNFLNVLSLNFFNNKNADAPK